MRRGGRKIKDMIYWGLSGQKEIYWFWENISASISWNWLLAPPPKCSLINSTLHFVVVLRVTHRLGLRGFFSWLPLLSTNKHSGEKSDSPLLVAMRDVSTRLKIMWGDPAVTDRWHDGLHVNAARLGPAAGSSECRRRLVTAICAADQMQESKRLQENKNFWRARVHARAHTEPVAYCWLTCSVMQCDCRRPAAVVTKASLPLLGTLVLH